MKIHAGYQISYDCPQPMPMILTLSVHPSRRSDLLSPDRILIIPPSRRRSIAIAMATFAM